MKKNILTIAAIAAVTGAAIYYLDIFFLILLGLFIIIAEQFQTAAK